MGRGIQGAVLKMLRAPEHALEVTGVREREPYTELSVRCPGLLGAQAQALPPTTWVRMWIPEGGREYQRAYTLIRMNRQEASARILVLHHSPAGPASRWARSVQPGQTVGIQVMGGTRYRPPAQDERMLLVGDPASAPALADAVEAAPPSCRVEAVMLAGAGGYLPRAGREHGWRMVDPQWPQAGQLAAVDEALGALGSATWAWVALESSLTRLVRRHLLDAGLARRAIQCQAYWIRGRAMGVAAETGRR
ncbi:siderophore-interacting protein [Actinomyces bowdenii]|uniref:siderophore-interacting protein n=1 Tax=Actinomyces bowdenii TaxID=131109 RepID=UPI001ABC4423|nr:siderophore-interacting protein [Actinomyces bowdenii]MBO3725017.1 siderophore-interacting protein [Actinomyces bowdenii]